MQIHESLDVYGVSMYLPRNPLFNSELIPYGWGHSETDGGNLKQEAIVFEETAELARSRGGAGASRLSGAVSPESSGNQFNRTTLPPSFSLGLKNHMGEFTSTRCSKVHL